MAVDLKLPSNGSMRRIIETLIIAAIIGSVAAYSTIKITETEMKAVCTRLDETRGTQREVLNSLRDLHGRVTSLEARTPPFDADHWERRKR